MWIRKSLEEDWRRIKEIEDKAIERYYTADFGEDEVLPRTEEDIRFLIANTQLMVAVDEADTILGYISYYSIGPYLHLEEHEVHEEYWRVGGGRSLLNHFLQAGEELETCQYYSLLVFPEAKWAWNCFLQSGFRTFGFEQIKDLKDENLQRMMEAELKFKNLARGRVLMIKEK